MLIFWLIAAINYCRIFWGVDVTDEAQYVATSLLYTQDAKPFINELFIQQTGSLIYAPLMSLWTSIFGYNGHFLFVRHLYFLTSLGTALLMLKWIQPKTGKLSAAVIAGLVLCFIPHSLPSLSYNTLGMFGFIAMICSFEIYQQKLKQRWIGLAAMAAATAMMANPLYAVGVLIYALVVCFVTPAHHRLKAALIFLATGIAATSPMLFVLHQAGLKNLQEAFQFSQAFAMSSISALGKLGYIFELLREEYRLPEIYLLVLAVFGIAARYWKEKSGSLLLLAAPTIFIFERACGGAGAGPVVHVIWVALGFIAFFYLLADSFIMSFTILSKRGKSPVKISPNAKLNLRIIMVCSLQSLVLCMYSSMTLYSMAYSLTPMLALLAMRLIEATNAGSVLPMVEPPSDFPHQLRLAGRQTQTLALITAFTLAISISNYFRMYNDFPIQHLDTLITQGPYAGLITGQGRAQLIETIQQDVKQAENLKAKSVLFFENFPAGYTMSSMYPATRSLFLHMLPFSAPVRSFYGEYYKTQTHRPDVYFDFKTFPLTETWKHISRFENDPLRLSLQNSAEYTLLHERGYYRVYIRRSLATQ